jgi:ADP-ribose pyrophosphatase
MKVYQDSVKLPSGLVIKDYSVVSLPSGVVVVATTPEGELIVQSEYKYAIDQTILNLPSGSVELGEAPIEVAQRELFEETGYQAEYFELIRTLYEYPSKATHVIHIVRGVNASKVRGTTH